MLLSHNKRLNQSGGDSPRAPRHSPDVAPSADVTCHIVAGVAPPGLDTPVRVPAELGVVRHGAGAIVQHPCQVILLIINIYPESGDQVIRCHLGAAGVAGDRHRAPDYRPQRGHCHQQRD